MFIICDGESYPAIQNFTLLQQSSTDLDWKFDKYCWCRTRINTPTKLKAQKKLPWKWSLEHYKHEPNLGLIDMIWYDNNCSCTIQNQLWCHQSLFPNCYILIFLPWFDFLTVVKDWIKAQYNVMLSKYKKPAVFTSLASEGKIWHN